MSMAKVLSMGSILSGGSSQASSSQVLANATHDDVVRRGYLKKCKTMKKRYFVLRRDGGANSPARLEYYDSEQKFLDGGNPNKQFILSQCFNISRKMDAKSQHMLALYIKKDCFCLLASSERELNEWLTDLKRHKGLASHDTTDGFHLPRDFEHVWQVEVVQRGLGSSPQLSGPQRVCLTSRYLSLVRLEDYRSRWDFQLNTIRRCGNTDQFFYVDMGRLAVTGCGELWMKTEDVLIAQNMHNIVGQAMREYGNTIARDRTASMSVQPNAVATSLGPLRNRCDSMPSRSSGESGGLVTSCIMSTHNRSPLMPSTNFRAAHQPLQRPQSISPSCGADAFGVECSRSQHRHSVQGNLITTAEHNFFTAHASPGSGGSSVLSPSDEYLPMEACSQGNGSGGDGEEQSGYLPMSPQAGLMASPPLVFTSAGQHSACHSRSSSILDESGEASMGHTAQLGSSYLDMTPTNPAKPTPIPCSRSEGDSLPEMSPGSGSSSYTSGTPSSEHRLQDFTHSSLFPGEEEEDEKLEDELGGFERPIRTSSVGSKPELIKSRKNSAPMLGISAVSHSWSGTSGMFFPGFLSRDHDRQSALMEVDFSKNHRSYDHIAAEDKERKSSSIERIKNTLTGHKHRSNSKSKSSSHDHKRDKKNSEGDASRVGIEIPSEKTSVNYFEMDFNPSPRSTASNTSEGGYGGYLAMRPGGSNSLSSTGSEYVEMGSSKELHRQTSKEPYLDMTPRSGGDEGYVDMTQGATPVSYSIGSASSSSSGSIGSRVRKTSNSFNPLSSMELPSPLEAYLDDLSYSYEPEMTTKKEKKTRRRFSRDNKRKKSDPCPSDVTESKSKGHLSTISNFLSRKNSNSSAPKTPLSPTGSPLPKSSRNSSSPFPSLGRSKSREEREPSIPPSSFSMGSQSVNSPMLAASAIPVAFKECDEAEKCSAIREQVSLLPTHSKPTVPRNTSTEVTNVSHSVDLCKQKRLSGSLELNSGISVENTSIKGQLGSLKPVTEAAHQAMTSESYDVPDGKGAYVNISLSRVTSQIHHSPSSQESDEPAKRLCVGDAEADSAAKVQKILGIQGSQCVEDESMETDRQYANITPSSSSTVSMPISDSSPTPISHEVKILNTAEHSQSSQKSDSGYLEMNMCSATPVSLNQASTVMRKSVALSVLLAGRPDPQVALERLSLVEPDLDSSSSMSERSRSHSGPGAPEASSINNRGKTGFPGAARLGSDSRTLSASCSPASYSPPTSPVLASSSKSSLSESGLSSASSTCTVINVGLKHKQQDKPAEAESKDCDVCQPRSENADEKGLNYASINFSPRQEAMTIPVAKVDAAGDGDCEMVPVTSESQLNYTQVDFGKSECLRNACLLRDTLRH